MIDERRSHPAPGCSISGGFRGMPTAAESLGRLAKARFDQGESVHTVGQALIDTLLHVVTTKLGGAAEGLSIDRHELRRRLHRSLDEATVGLIEGAAIHEERRANSDGHR